MFNKKINKSIFDDKDIKNQIIDFVYNKLNLKTLNYKIINSVDDLKSLKDNKHYCRPNYKGINSLLICTKINNRCVSCIIKRSDLQYRNSNKINFIKAKVCVDKNIFNNTILEGTLINYNKEFIINDIYYLNGENLLDQKLGSKCINMDCYLNAKQKTYDKWATKLTVNERYNIEQTRELCEEIIPKLKLFKFCNGITFYPEISKQKLIYVYDLSPKRVEDIEIKQNKLVIEKDNICATFKIKSTETTDVYKLYILQKINKNNKKVAKHVFYNIAYLPTKESSIFCKKIFESNDNKNIYVKCKYNLNKQKWTPFELDKKSKRAFTINDIKKSID
jgi:hypothetical protein